MSIIVDIIVISVLIAIVVIPLSLIDRWFFRKIIIINTKPIDEDRHLLITKTIMFFGLIRTSVEYVAHEGKYYMKLREDEVSTHETEPRFIRKALLKYKLEK